MQVPGFEAVGHHVREATRLAPGRPAVWLGVRVATATALPLVGAAWFGPAVSTFGPLGGFLVALADKGGAYRTRATTMASVALGGGAAIALGTLVAGHRPFTGVIVALGLALCALSHAWGATKVSIGNSVAILLVVAASLPSAAGETLERVVGFAGGAAIAMGLTLLVWPVRIYEPGRRAIAAAFDGLAAQAARLARAAEEGAVTGAAWREEATAFHRTLRERIETARGVLTATRRGRRGETGRGDRLLAVLHVAEQMFGTLVGIEEVLDAGSDPVTRAALADGLALHARSLAELADLVVIERPPVATTPHWDAAAAGAHLGELGAVEHGLAEHAIGLLARTDSDRGVAAGLIRSIGDDSEPLRALVPDLDPPAPFRDTLLGALDLESAVLRHAIRVAVTSLIAMTLAWALALPHGHWVTIAAFLLLQPYRAATRIRAVQRIAGTVLGCAIAAAIPWLVDDPRIMMVLVIALAGISASVVQLNYALYATFLTPTFILLAEVHTHDVHLVEVRIVATLIGAALAVAASRFLWSTNEHDRFDDQLAGALDAAARYFAEVVAAARAGTPPPAPAVIASRRAFGLALNHAELALEAVIADRAATAMVEPRMTLVSVTRRFGTAINAFGSVRSVASYAPHAVELSAFAASVEARLHEVATALRAGVVPEGRPRVERAVSDPVIAARLARVELQLAVLGEAAMRAARSARAGVTRHLDLGVRVSL